MKGIQESSLMLRCCSRLQQVLSKTEALVMKYICYVKGKNYF